MSYLPLDEYGIIGNQNSAALISRLGSIDWCCLPFLDSPSHFGSLLDDHRGGFFSITPAGDFHSEQKYLYKTNILETHFETPSGRAILHDWFPIENEFTQEPIIQRKVEVLEGEIHWVLNCSPRFNYGSTPAEIEVTHEGIVFRGSSPEDLAILQGTIPLSPLNEKRSAHAKFTLQAGQNAQFTWIFGRHGKSKAPLGPKPSIDFWRSCAHNCSPQGCIFAGPWHDLIIRSSLLLKLMITHFSGTIAEAVTTSLPSLTGGGRNWDYRYTWMRDSALTLQALNSLNYQEEAQTFFNWLADIVIRDGAERLQAVYTLDGNRNLPETELPFLNGYKGAHPVRIGNLSARQFQLDVFGHVMLSCAQAFAANGSLPPLLWTRLVEITEYVCQAWRRPDRGPWEIRAKPEHFVASKVMCWVTLDRAIWLAQALNHPVPRRWNEERNALHHTITTQGYDSQRRSFVKAFGSRELDSATLLIPLLGFLPIEDERVQNTLDAIRQELSEGVLIYRYRSMDSPPDSDGAHLLSSFWFISCLALSGRVDEASDRLAEICSYATPLGLFGEQLNPTTGHPVGNFPCSSVHLALINASLYIGLSRGRKLPNGSLISRVLQTPIPGKIRAA